MREDKHIQKRQTNMKEMNERHNKKEKKKKQKKKGETNTKNKTKIERDRNTKYIYTKRE